MIAFQSEFAALVLVCPQISLGSTTEPLFIPLCALFLITAQALGAKSGPP